MRSTLVLVTVLLTATALLAQTFRGTVLGTVTDQTGAVIAGAKVSVKNANTGLERTTQTSADGSYAGPRIAHRNLHRDRVADRISNLRPPLPSRLTWPRSAAWILRSSPAKYRNK